PHGIQRRDHHGQPRPCARVHRATGAAQRRVDGHTVGGDPAILSDCGNLLMTASMTMDAGRSSMAQHQVRGRRLLASGVGPQGAEMLRNPVGRMGLAGTPATITSGSTSRVTTEPAPITAPSPIVTPG